MNSSGTINRYQTRSQSVDAYMPYLSILESDPPQHYTLESALTFGRSSGNNVVLKEALSSRNHFEVHHENGVFTLKDLGSRNGTFVNGVKTKGECPLEDGDKIHVGATCILFTVGDTPPLKEGASESAPVVVEAKPKSVRSRPSSRVKTQIGHEPLTTSHVIPTGPMLVNFQDTAQHFKLTDGQTSFGRKKDCTYPLNIEGLSGHHAQVDFKNGNYILSDSGSTNGTLHNRVRLQDPVELQNGDFVQIGSLKAVYFDPKDGQSLEAMISRIELQHVSADMDYEIVARSQRSKSNTIPATIIIVLLLIALGSITFMAKPETQQVNLITAVEGNLLGEDASFEGKGDLSNWDSSALRGGVASLDDSHSTSGTSSLHLKAGTSGQARLHYSKSFPAQHGDTFTIQLKALTQGINAPLRAGLHWVIDGYDGNSDSTGCVWEKNSDTFLQAMSDVLIAPPGTSACQLWIAMDATKGDAWLDDVAVVSVPKPFYTGAVVGHISAFVSETGAVTIFQNRTVLIRDLQLHLLSKEDELITHVAARMNRSREERSEFSISLTGSLSSSSAQIPFRVLISRGTDQGLSCHFKLLSAAPELVRSVRLSGLFNTETKLQEQFGQASSDEWVWPLGSDQALLRSSVAFRLMPQKSDVQWSAVDLVPDTSNLKASWEWSLHFRPIPADTMTNLTSLRTRIDKLDRPEYRPALNANWREEAKGVQFGEAYNLLKTIRSDYWFMRNDADYAKKRMAQIESLLEEFVSGAEAAYQEATQFDIYEDYKMAHERYSIVQSLFSGMQPERNDLAKFLRGVSAHIQELANDINNRQTQQIDKNAGRLLSLAQSEKKFEHHAAALALCQEILLRYPDTVWATRAQSLAKELKD